MKNYLEKVIAEKEQRVSDLKARVEASQDVNEVRNITAEVENLNKEISEARAELVKVNELAADNFDVLERGKVPANATVVGKFNQGKVEAKGDVLVIPGDCGWNDVGSWDMMDVLHTPDGDGNVLLGDVVAIDAKDSVIYSSGKTVTAVDVEGLVIVETPDAIMVCRKDKAQNVKKIVDALSEAGRKDLL